LVEGEARTQCSKDYQEGQYWFHRSSPKTIKLMTTPENKAPARTGAAIVASAVIMMLAMLR